MSNSTPQRLRWLRNFEETLGTALLLLIFLCVAVQVLTRMFLQSPPFWTEEAARYMFVWLVCLGSAEVVRTRGHITMDLLAMLIPETARAILSILLNIIICASLIVLVWYGTLGAMRAHRVVSIALGVPESFLYGALPVGAAFMSIRVALAVVWDIISFGKTENDGSAGGLV